MLEQNLLKTLNVHHNTSRSTENVLYLFISRPSHTSQCLIKLFFHLLSRQVESSFGKTYTIRLKSHVSFQSSILYMYFLHFLKKKKSTTSDDVAGQRFCCTRSVMTVSGQPLDFEGFVRAAEMRYICFRFILIKRI